MFRTITFLFLGGVLHAAERELDCAENLLIRTQKVVAIENGRTLLTPSGGRFRNFSLEPYTFGPGEKFKTTRYFPTRSTRPEEADAVVALLHGMNAETSQAGSMFNAMNALTKPSKNLEPESPIYQARKISRFAANVYAEALDQPGCGNNCDLAPLTTEGMIEFYVEYLRDLRRRAPGKPLIAVGFCYSAGFLIEVNRRHPGLIDALVLTGLIVPEGKIGFDFAAAVETGMYADGSLIENPAVRTKADLAYSALTWSRVELPTGATPTLLLVGENDMFQSPEAIEWFANWEKRSPHSVKFRRVAGAGHGVLGPVEGFPDSYVSVLFDIHNLIKQVLNWPT